MPSAETRKSFHAKSYWEDRFAGSVDLTTVGYTALGEPFNRWMYRLRRGLFVRTARSVQRSWHGASVLDVGAGSGFYIERWRELGVTEIRACDLTDIAVERLRRVYPGYEIATLDISGDPELLPPWQVDAISAFDVTFHIVSDDALAQAFRNMYALLQPGGVLIFTDNFVHAARAAGSHHVSRTIDTLESSVCAAGFEIVSRRPAFFLMNEPVDTESTLHWRFWRALVSLLERRPAFGGPLGATLLPLDAALIAALREGPSTEIMVCRKPA